MNRDHPIRIPVHWLTIRYEDGLLVKVACPSESALLAGVASNVKASYLLALVRGQEVHP